MEEKHSLFYRPNVWEKAKNHFDPILEEKDVLGEPTYIFERDSHTLVPGARTTAMLPLSGIIELFGDLIENNNFSAIAYTQRDKDEGYGIPEAVFIDWLKRGVLYD